MEFIIIPNENVEKITKLAKEAKFKEIEELNFKILISNDHVYILGNDIFQRRMSIQDKFLTSKGVVEVKGIIFSETWLRQTKSLNGDLYYTFGALFGEKSIILGPKFETFKKSKEFKAMINKKLKNVKFELEQDQFTLKHYEFRE